MPSYFLACASLNELQLITSFVRQNAGHFQPMPSFLLWREQVWLRIISDCKINFQALIGKLDVIAFEVFRTRGTPDGGRWFRPAEAVSRFGAIAIGSYIEALQSTAPSDVEEASEDLTESSDESAAESEENSEDRSFIASDDNACE